MRAFCFGVSSRTRSAAASSLRPVQMETEDLARSTTRQIRRRLAVIPVACLLFGIVAAAGAQDVTITGELKTWHRVTLSFAGAETSEAAEPNPFTDYRLLVTFSNGDYSTVVPGFYAADGNAGETSADRGNVWRVHFSPNMSGEWSFDASFRTGPNVVLSPAQHAGTKTGFNGERGSFVVEPTDKTGRDFRHHGRLEYVGEHYFRFAGSGDYYIKGGADSPENILGFHEFDNTFDIRQPNGFIHKFEPHISDWRPGDPTWQGGKGKGIIGALNYLAGKGVNSVYFLTYNVDAGDGKDTWMWTDPDERKRFDTSKLDQWEIVFDHMDRLGMMLHVVTQERENDFDLGQSPGLNPVRNLYYRELVARFAHHNAVIWNLGEENNTPDSDRKDIANYIRSIDPYDHPITVHTHPHKAMTFYDGLLGDPNFEATSIQADMGVYNRDADVLRQRSAKAGRKWAIFGDEQQPARVGIAPDAVDPTHDLPRKQALWGNLMGGGSGVEWYFGSKHPPCADLTCEDLRTRDTMYEQTRYALEFFQTYLPFWEMEPDNGLAFSYGALVLANPGEIYAVYLPYGGPSKLDLEDEYTFDVRWYNPRTGGALQKGTVTTVEGEDYVSLGLPPQDDRQDWVALITRAASDAQR